jgi:hypothetical protein
VRAVVLPRRHRHHEPLIGYEEQPLTAVADGLGPIAAASLVMISTMSALAPP